ncbi:MAG: hypothetical protein J07HX5_01735 [halophilic archaeon J07HX5]|nr:MAG: hypothetical protein J07HX5_01735 [halophilic archaeon J07HX5]
MEPWKALGLASVTLVAWGGVMTISGYSPGPLTVGAATAFVIGSLYLGDRIGQRIASDD